MIEALARDAWFSILTVALNGAVTWGIVRTQLAWLRRDVDELRAAVFGRKAARQED